MAATSDLDRIASARTHDLASLLYPVSTTEFFARHWECAPLHVQHRGTGYYDTLLTSRDVEGLIADPDARYPAIRLARGGRFLPAEAYARDVQVGQVNFQGVPDLGKITVEYAKGATIALTAVDRRWEPIRTLCTDLEGMLDFTLHSNIYVTPGRAAGFPPHYDTHEVLILQIAGKKRWYIDQPTIRLPHKSQTCIPERYVPGPRLMELELEPGDLLYLPRGYGHSTTTSSSFSSHITIGINVYTWFDLVGNLLPSATESEELRRALPAGFASRAELRPALKDKLIELLGPSTGIDLDRALDQVMAAFKVQKRRRPVPFRADVVVLTPESSVEVAATDYRVVQNTDGVALQLRGYTCGFPAAFAPLLGAMCSRVAFRLQDLPSSHDLETTLSFARYLQSVGFLRATG